MSHPHRRREGVEPRPSGKELRRWERLLTRAARVARDPMGDAGPMVAAAEKASGACAPRGHQQAGSAFVVLVREARGFLKLNAVQRVETAERIGGLVAQCRAVLDARAATKRTACVPDRKGVDE